MAAGSITDVSLEIPGWLEVIDVLTLQAGFNSALVIIGAALLGISAGVVGAFAMLRKRALMGDALAHCALPGLAAAFIIAVYLEIESRSLVVLLSGAALSGVLGVLTVQLLSRYTRIHEDSAIGAVLSVFFGAGIVLLSIIQSMETGSAGGLSRFIYGQTAAMRTDDAYLLTVAALVITGACFALIKEFSLVCFDREFAVVQGWPISRIDLLMMTLVTVVTVIGLQSVGLILIVALLIIPAAAARFWTENLSRMVFISAFIGGISGYLGSAGSALFPRLPAGAVIVLATGAVFLLSFLFAPRRGLLVGALRLFQLRYRVQRDHLLRNLYEHCEKQGCELQSPVPRQSLSSVRGGRSLRSSLLVRFMALKGIVRLHRGGIALTEVGLAEAARVIRNHRLWEQYILESASISSSHVDYSADYVEHVLSPDIVRMLEERLAARGISAAGPGAPASPHPIGER